MAHRARTLNQGLALAFGSYRYRSQAGTDVEAIMRRQKKEEEIQSRGQQMCWHCEEGFDVSLETCPHCGTDVMPF